MVKYKGNYVILTLCFVIHFNAVTSAQTAKVIQNNNLTELTKGINQAILNGYGASVLMWEIDAESGSRKSAQFSGVVVSGEGIILSAAHVVMPDNTYKVMFPDGRECIAKGLGRITIPPTHMLPDAAMLKIIDKGIWPFAEMGWSSTLKTNTPCVSIAYPESQEQRKPMVRFGCITSPKNEYGFLQSNCVMEPGDSGGPLFDLSGRVIGIHSGIQIPEQVNYEVPIDIYRKFWNALSKPINYKSLPADSGTVASHELVNNTVSYESKNLFSNPKIKGVSSQLGCVKILSIVNGKEQQIAATLLSTKGMALKPAFYNKSLLISKSSEIGENPVVLKPGGEKIKVSIVARSQKYDLVLLLVPQFLEGGINLKMFKQDTISFKSLGAYLISPQPASAFKAGVIGSMLLNLPKITSYGYIGATTAVKNDNLMFTYIQPNSAAQVSDLQVNDIIKKVDGKEVEDSLDFLKALQQYSAGDTTIINVLREGKEYAKKVVLKYPPQKVGNHPAELFAGGKSIRRDGFNKVFVHDSLIKAFECGGPVWDINGYFMGINIARLSRTTTIVMPAFSIQKFMISNLHR